MRLTAAVALCALLTGCFARTDGGRLAQGLIGVGIASGGFGVIAASRTDETPVIPGTDSPTSGDINCITGGACLLGGLLIIVGVAMTGFALEEPDRDRDEEDPPLLYTSPPDPHPNLDADGMPEVATDKITLQLARSVRSAVKLGNCGAARIILRKIERRDRFYHFSFVRTELVAPCR